MNVKQIKTPVEKCIHCNQLILGKISKSDATRCQILRLKCTEFNFRWALPQTPLGELTALPKPPSCILRGPIVKGRGSRGRRREGGKGKEKGEKERGRDFAGPMSNCFIRACFSNAIFRRVEQQFNKIPTDVVGLSRSLL